MLRLRICLSGRFAVVLLLVLAAGVELRGQDERLLRDARQRMVREEVIEAGIKNERVIASLRETPRHRFVPRAQRHLAYYDLALPIGSGQTISPPFVVASMTQALDPRPTDRVLEIGTGSGYQAAVLSPLVAEVYSIEIVEELGRKAAQTLRRLDYDNVYTRIGDGFQGWPERAPFDKIIVTCSPERIPVPLVEQLREGGRMVIPLGERFQQTMYLLRKQNGELMAESLEPTFFVPMVGRAEELRRADDGEGLPRMINGSFEESDDAGNLQAWYYVRQAEVVANNEAADGTRWLRFQNETPGRSAQALQAVGMDGRQVQEIELSAWIATDNVNRGLSPQELPRLELSFFDERRAPIGSLGLGPWHGTSSWTRRHTRIQVPQQARLAVLAVGLFGATGQLLLDDVNITIVRQTPLR